MTAAERVADLSVLWKEASVVFPYFDRCAVDWDAAYREYLEKVMQAETPREFHLLMSRFINLLGDGHTDYTLPKELMEETGMLPFSLKYVDGGYCVRAIRRDGEQHLAKRILSVNGIPMERLIGEMAQYMYHVGDFLSRPNQILPLLLKSGDNILETTAGIYRFDLEHKLPDMTVVKDPAVSVPHKVVSSGKLDMRLYEGGILYVKMNDFMYRGAADEIREALHTCGAIRGVVLDVRENIGGMTKFASDVAALFISGEYSFLRKHTRSVKGSEIASAGQILLMSEEERVKWCSEEDLEDCRRIDGRAKFEEWVGSAGESRHQALYSGACVILTSRYTISAAEDFVAMFRSTGRAAVMGEPTQGTTGTPLILRLAGGGRARICSIGNRLMDGTEFIGVGIEPDETLICRAEDYAAGRDRVLAAALKKMTT